MSVRAKLAICAASDLLLLFVTILLEAVKLDGLDNDNVEVVDAEELESRSGDLNKDRAGDMEGDENGDLYGLGVTAVK